MPSLAPLGMAMVSFLRFSSWAMMSPSSTGSPGVNPAAASGPALTSTGASPGMAKAGVKYTAPPSESSSRARNFGPSGKREKLKVLLSPG